MKISKARTEKVFAGTEVLTSVRDWVRFAVSLFNREELFFGQGSRSAYDEALYLVQRVLHLPLEGPETFLDAHP